MEKNRANKTWTAEEDEYLSERWGRTSVPKICKELGRTKNAIMLHAQRIGLPPFWESGDYVTFNQLIKALIGTRSASYQSTSWIKNRGFPIHYRRCDDKRCRIVYLHEFWEWAEKNRSFLDFSKIEPFVLGKEPPWVAEQRKRDWRAAAMQRKDPWTEADDSRLVMLLKQNKYGYAELSRMLCRSAGAIQKRCNTLGIEERPVKAYVHGESAKWTEADYELLADGIRNGDSYAVISERIGKSDKSIRGKCYYVYLTENADKIRAMIGAGAWGDGAPVPTVRQALKLSRSKTETKHLLERLAGVLSYRTLTVKSDYDRYFQRAVCVNWNERDCVCSAGCDDCDSCVEFVRIRPQYCARCGATFFERTPSELCRMCRMNGGNQNAEM